MAGRIMTRMTTDVDQFESLIENGLLSALVSIVTFVGVGVALVIINAELRPLDALVAIRLPWQPSCSVRRRLACTACRASGLPSSMRIFRRASPGFASRRPSSMKTLR